MKSTKSWALKSAVLFAVGGVASLAQAATISISCGSVGQSMELCQAAVGRWMEKTGHEVNVVSTPNSTTEQLALFQQLLAAEATDIDVFQIDVIWPGILANHFIDFKEYASEEQINQHFPAIIANNTVDDRLVGMPWYTDAGLLYYRSDLLEKHGFEPPETWQQLTETAQAIQEAERAEGNEQLWGFIWQGKAYEGLTCDALEWVSSHNGGTIVDADGSITINNPQAVAAIDLAASWVKNITPEGVLNYAEEESRGLWQSGNAVFMRNWPYAWSLAQGEGSEIKGKVGVAPLPKGGDDGRNAATLGGWQLAVSKYSENAELAADLVLFLTSPEEQKYRALEGSYNPTITALYEDPEILEANPFFGDLYETFVSAVPRPSTPTGGSYNQVSNEFWNAVHAVLSGNKDAATSLADLESSLNRMSRGGRRW